MKNTLSSAFSLSIDTKKPFLFLVLSLLIWSLMTPSFLLGIVNAQDQATMLVDPSSIVDPDFAPTGTFTVTVYVSDVTDLFKWQVGLRFDPSVLECTVAYLPAGRVFDGKRIVPVALEIDNVEGSVLFSISLSKYSGETVDVDSGVLCAMDFNILDRGSCDLILDDADSSLHNSDLEEIPTILQDGFFDNRLNGHISQNSPRMFVVPASIVDPGLTPSNNFTIFVNVSDVVGLFTWQLRLLFDPAIMECTDAYYPPGHVFDGLTTIPVEPTIDNVAGFILFGSTLLLEPVDVDQGVMCALDFHVIDTGSCDLTLDSENSFLLNFDLDDIPTTLEDGFFDNRIEEEIHDIAVTDVSPSPTSVTVGDSVTIDVTVENKGDFTETFDVTAYYDGNTIDTLTDVSLNVGESDILSFTWDTTGVPLGSYTISANATIVPGEEETADNVLADDTVEVVEAPPPHDIAVTDVTPAPTSVVVGETVTIDVTVENQGTETETFDVTAYYDGNAIDTIASVSLNAGESDVLPFSWDTTGVPLGTYTISANATIVPGEEETADNSLVDDTVEVVEAPPLIPSILSSDSEGEEKNQFLPDEHVYASGENYTVEESVTVYVVVTGGPYTSDASLSSVPAQADALGNLGPVDLGTFQPGEYDIWVDINGNGELDEETEPVDTFGATAGFLVIPEYFIGTILGLAGCFAAFAVFGILKRRR